MTANLIAQFRMICMSLMLCVGSSVCAFAQVDADQSVKQALPELGGTPWYDAESQSVKPVTLESTENESAHRNSRWVPGASRVKSTTSSSSSSNSSGGWFGTNITTANVIGWAIIGIAFVVASGMLIYAFSKLSPDGSSGSLASNQGKRSLDEQTLNRIKELPAELRRTDVDLRTEAERLMIAGEFDEAIKCLFGHQLLLLDRRGWLRLSRGKTNGRYVREVSRENSDAGRFLRATADAFEASYFGRHTPTQHRFSGLWETNQQLERLTAGQTQEVPV